MKSWNKGYTLVVFCNGDPGFDVFTVGKLLGGNGMTKDEIITAIGGIILNDSEDENVQIGDDLYYYEDLHIL